MNLGAVFVCDLLQRLDLDDNLLVANEVGLVFLFEGSAFVVQKQLGLRTIRYGTHRKLALQTILIHGLQKSATHFVIDLETGPDDGKRLIPEHNLPIWTPELEDDQPRITRIYSIAE